MKMGRPSKMNDLTLQKLQDAFLMGCTDSEACLYAGIVPSTLYNYQAQNLDFMEQKETCKQNPFLKARKVILDALEGGDLSTAQKVLDRKDKLIAAPDDTDKVKDPAEYSDNDLMQIIANG